MAVSRSSVIPPPAPSTLLTPLLPALTAAAASKEPATSVLPLLAPILRQRVKFLSPSSTDPWLRLLCYDTGKAAKLAEIVTSEKLEPHPVSGEVEVDWDYDSETKFRRVDSETLQALIVLKELDLAFQLVYCVGDAEGGGDGWRIGEVTVPTSQSPFAAFGGATTIAAAEEQFKFGDNQAQPVRTNGNHLAVETMSANDEDDDDDYWARYDATPARTPAQKLSPAPQSSGGPVQAPSRNIQPSADDEDDDYYAQYDQVQPAMDNHDPDEEAAAQQYATPLGLGQSSSEQRPQTNGTHEAHAPSSNELQSHIDRERIAEGLLHPRPESSASSNGSQMVARLEEEAGKQDHNEFGVKQHISRSVRSLFMLSRASGIDREEFERIVKTEIDLLGMMGDMD